MPPSNPTSPTSPLSPASHHHLTLHPPRPSSNPNSGRNTPNPHLHHNHHRSVHAHTPNSSASSLHNDIARDEQHRSPLPPAVDPIGDGYDHDVLGEAGARPDYSEQKIVVAMVGLPARGKSYLSNKLQRYLKWLEYDVKVFNVGQLRRALARTKLKESGVQEDHTASFFDPNNPDAYKLRSQMATECLEQLISWLKRGGNVGIHDATNTTKARREEIARRVAKEPNLKLVFLESICTDPAVIAANVAVKVSSGDPDYAGMSPEEAKKDFLARIKNYEDAYQPVDADGTEAHLSYCKIFDVGQQVIVNQIHGYLESRIAFYLMNLHLTPRNIFFSRVSGQSRIMPHAFHALRTRTHKLVPPESTENRSTMYRARSAATRTCRSGA